MTFPRRLFGVAGELEDILGRALALRLIGDCWRYDEKALRWRTALYVPKVLPLGHHLEALLGRDAAQRLVDRFGGEILQPPRCSDVVRDAEQRGIRELAARGLQRRHIAFLMACSVRQVQRSENGR